MKAEEVLESLKKGNSIKWSEWGGRRYTLYEGNKYTTIRGSTIGKLIDLGIVKIMRSKDSPLTGSVRLIETEAKTPPKGGMR